ncbi:DgyrCDS12142 [Dimorphilus gyrociliatus]|uniref:DgyrCDS12142 n=1 Tax=Dimorphilus gyrociliatus TaxID=2664684 RepID=A0A7I8W6F6_9ANNE|nr:DgyrCDS12142 [Dimorphilus gyrociliatus]
MALRPEDGNQELNLQGQALNQECGSKSSDIPSHDKIQTNGQDEEMDWQCKSCGKWNYGDILKCASCKTSFDQTCKRYDPKTGELISPAVTAQSNNRSTSKPPFIIKRGDWNCLECETINFKNKRDCFGCKAKINDTIHRYGQKNDWTCKNCLHFNFSVNSSCENCRKELDDTDIKIQSDYILLSVDNEKIDKAPQKGPTIVFYPFIRGPSSVLKAKDEFELYGKVKDVVIKNDNLYMLFAEQKCAQKACVELKSRFGTQLCYYIPEKKLELNPTVDGTFELRYYRYSKSEQMTKSQKNTVISSFLKYGNVQGLRETKDRYVYIEFKSHDEAVSVLNSKIYGVEIPPEKRLSSVKPSRTSRSLSRSRSPKHESRINSSKNPLSHGVHQCKVCEMYFENDDSFNFHCQGTLHKFKMNKIGSNKTLPDPDFYGSRFYSKLNGLQCKLCKNQFTNNRDLNLHFTTSEHMHNYDKTERAMKENRILEVFDRLENIQDIRGWQREKDSEKEDENITNFNHGKTLIERTKLDCDERIVIRKSQKDVSERREKDPRQERSRSRDRFRSKVVDIQIDNDIRLAEKRKIDLDAADRIRRSDNPCKRRYGDHVFEDGSKRNDIETSVYDQDSFHGLDLGRRYEDKFRSDDSESRKASRSIEKDWESPQERSIPINPGTIAVLTSLKQFVRMMREADCKNNHCKRNFYEKIARDTGIVNSDIIESAMETLRRTSPTLLSLIETLDPKDLAIQEPTKIAHILDIFSPPIPNSANSTASRPRY